MLQPLAGSVEQLRSAQVEGHVEKTSRSRRKPLTQPLEVLLDGRDLLLVVGLG